MLLIVVGMVCCISPSFGSVLDWVFLAFCPCCPRKHVITLEPHANPGLARTEAFSIVGSQFCINDTAIVYAQQSFASPSLMRCTSVRILGHFTIVLTLLRELFSGRAVAPDCTTVAGEHEAHVAHLVPVVDRILQSSKCDNAMQSTWAF